MSWRLARSLEGLRAELNAAAPNRSKSSDGSIGDTAHSSRTSDHNPNPDGVVCAIDVTNDPRGGMPGQGLADALIASKDPRIKYVIWNRQICSGSGQKEPAWKWRKYGGTNPHDHHVHISVKPSKVHYDNEDAWSLNFRAVEQPDAPPAPSHPVLRKGDSGANVEALQRALNRKGAMLTVDGDFGAKTEAALKKFQRGAKLVPDGIAGTYTFKALGL